MLKGGGGDLPLLDLDVEPVRIVRTFGKRKQWTVTHYFGEDGQAQRQEAERAMQWADTQPGERNG